MARITDEKVNLCIKKRRIRDVKEKESKKESFGIKRREGRGRETYKRQIVEACIGDDMWLCSFECLMASKCRKDTNKNT